MDCSLPLFSIHGIFQARVLEWAAISSSRGSSRPRDRTWVSCIAGRRFYRLSHQGSHPSLAKGWGKQKVLLAIPLPHFGQIATKYLYPISQLGSKGRFIFQPISLLSSRKWGRGMDIVTLQFPNRTVISRWNMEPVFHPPSCRCRQGSSTLVGVAALVGWSRSWISTSSLQASSGSKMAPGWVLHTL